MDRAITSGVHVSSIVTRTASASRLRAESDKGSATTT